MPTSVDALHEPLVALVGALAQGIEPPEPWGDFQVRTLTKYTGERGRFNYAEPFSRL